MNSEESKELKSKEAVLNEIRATLDTAEDPEKVGLIIYLQNGECIVTPYPGEWINAIDEGYDALMRPYDGNENKCITEIITFVDDGLMSFGEATDHMKQGHRVAREGWNGKDQYVRYMEPASKKAVTVEELRIADEHGMIHYNAYFELKTVSGALSTWVPSVTDALAEDWIDLDAE